MQPNPPPVIPDDALQRGDRIERYEVVEVLGVGATAIVYKVRHVKLGTLHALKVLTLFSPSIQRRMLQEGRVQAGLQHKNVVSVYDVLDVNGAPGLLMQIVEGDSLEDLLRKHRPDLPEAIALFRGIVEGVKVAHDRGLVHRDLKPANVLLARTPRGLVPRVTDFGIAKVTSGLGTGRTRTGVTMGTPRYMAPEQIRDAATVDARADIFSLGCILYELVTGHVAFPQDDLLTLYNAVCEGNYRPPARWLPGIPPNIEETIVACLTVDRDERVGDCRTLLELLDSDGPIPKDDSTEVLPPFPPASSDRPPQPATLAPAHHYPEWLPFALVAIACFAVAAAALAGAVAWTGAGEDTEQAAAPVEEPVEAALTQEAAPPPEVAATPAKKPEKKAAPKAKEREKASKPKKKRKTQKAKPVAEPKPEPVAAPVVEDPSEIPTANDVVVLPVSVTLETRPRSSLIAIGEARPRSAPQQLELTPGRHKVVFRSGARRAQVHIVVDAEHPHWCYSFKESRLFPGACP